VKGNWQEVTSDKLDPERDPQNDLGRYYFDECEEGEDIKGNVISKPISDPTIKGLIGKRILPARVKGAQKPYRYNYKL